ncbi:hypothetical protein Pelo_19913 [Pelomyxa schiedti]|nr:hypothetical protein Pelo_19913 [Pelomyxa schiedti]
MELYEVKFKGYNDTQWLHGERLKNHEALLDYERRSRTIASPEPGDVLGSYLTPLAPFPFQRDHNGR